MATQTPAGQFVADDADISTDGLIGLKDDEKGLLVSASWPVIGVALPSSIGVRRGSNVHPD
jgi:hypothetical protein